MLDLWKTTPSFKTSVLQVEFIPTFLANGNGNSIHSNGIFGGILLCNFKCSIPTNAI